MAPWNAVHGHLPGTLRYYTKCCTLASSVIHSVHTNHGHFYIHTGVCMHLWSTVLLYVRTYIQRIIALPWLRCRIGGDGERLGAVQSGKDRQQCRAGESLCLLPEESQPPGQRWRRRRQQWGWWRTLWKVRALSLSLSLSLSLFLSPSPLYLVHTVVVLLMVAMVPVNQWVCVNSWVPYEKELNSF